MFIMLSFGSFFCAAATDPGKKETTQRFNPIHSIVMFSNTVQDTMVVDVSLPTNYEVDTAARYPVLFLTDGYWRRGQHQSIHNMAADENVKEIIIIGIGYPDSYSPDIVRVRDLISDPCRFLDFVASQLIPYVDANYRTSKERTLWGSSYGGFFAMYTLFNSYANTKGVFGNYIVASAAALEKTSCGGSATDLFGCEQTLFSHTTELPASLYIAVGGNEDTNRFVNPFKSLVEKLHERNYTGFHFTSFIDPGKDHYTVWEPTLYEGVRKFLSK